MNMLLLIGIVAVFVANIVLGIFVYLNDTSKVSNRYFALLCFSLSLWAGLNYLADYQLTNTLLWTRLTFFVITYALVFLILFFNTFPKSIFKNKIASLTALMMAALVSVVTLFPGFIPGVEIKDGISNVQTGPLYSIFLVYFLLFAIALVTLVVLAWKRSKGQDRSKVKYLIFGILAMAILASLSNLILPLLLGSNEYAKYGTLSTLIFVGFTAYAIIRHSLFDIRAVVARSFTYALTIISIGAIYGFVTFGVIGRYVFSDSISQISLGQQLLNTLLAVLLAFTFQPIRRFFQKVTDSIFYRDKYDPQDLINSISLILASEIEVDELCKKVCKELTSKMRLSGTQAIVLDRGKIIYDNSDSKDTKLTTNEIKKLGNGITYTHDLNAGSKLDTLKNLNASLAIALKTRNQFIGYLLVSDKKSGEVFNAQDIETLKIIASEFSVALENAIAFIEIQQFNATLQQKIQLATGSLRKANDQLKELDQAKDEFISMAGHQLRTPLTTVKGYVSMLNDGDFGNLTKDQKNSVTLALDGSNRMARLIDDLLNVSRMEAGKFFIDASQVDLNKLVPEEIGLLKTQAESKKVTIKYKAPSKPIPKMTLDDNKTRQVVMNIAENAIQYSPTKGGKIEISLEKDNDKVVFMVKDNGIGVPKDQQAKLFTKMFRASNAKEVRPDGTGLGLFLVKRVIEDQGGKIIFESKPGKGSTFGFIMPIHNHIVVDKKAKQKLLANSQENK